MKTPIRKLPSTRLLFLASTIALFVAVAMPAAAQVQGAIFTTNASGSQVDGNIYPDFTAPYLNGGPNNAQCSAGALVPDGDYYFQVTDPSGGTLLSNDAVEPNRRVTVTNGVITANLGTHSTGSTNACGSIAVALCTDGTNDLCNASFNGEYKAWMTPVANYNESCSASAFGFCPSDSKTDNFRLRTQPGCTSNCAATPVVTGYKWYDTNTNGVWDTGEPPIPGWRISETDMSTHVTFFSYTDNTGLYSSPVDSNNTYAFFETLPANSTWQSTACQGNTSVGPPGTTTLAAQLSGASTTCTSLSSASVVTGTNNNIAGPNFGNVCTGGGGGLTIGYWSNQNGQAEWVPIPYAGSLSITSSSTGPNLVNGAGTLQNFSSSSNYSAFRTWLLSATATNMAYMLSAQNAGMWENVFGLTTGPNGTRSPVSLTALIYTGPVAGTAPSGCTKLTPNAGGFAAVGDVMSAASCAVKNAPITTKSSPQRTYEQFLKNALDAANNNNSFVQVPPDANTIPAACAFTTPY